MSVGAQIDQVGTRRSGGRPGIALAVIAAAIVVSIVIAGMLVVLRSDPATPTRVSRVNQGVATAVVPEAPYGRGAAKEGSALAPRGAVSWSAEGTGRSPQQR
jgi:hypothetical protein